MLALAGGMVVLVGDGWSFCEFLDLFFSFKKLQGRGIIKESNRKIMREREIAMGLMAVADDGGGL